MAPKGDYPLDFEGIVKDRSKKGQFIAIHPTIFLDFPPPLI